MIVFFTFVFFTVSFFINLFLIDAFFRRGQIVASFFTFLITVILGLCICALIPRGFKDQTQNETEWVCTIVDDQKICTRNQKKEAREDKTSDSDWDCVTEGNRKICIKHGAAK